MTDAVVATSSTSMAPQTIAMTGASGLVGEELTALLTGNGHTVLPIKRGEKADADAIRWDVASGLTNPGRLAGVDTVVHLAGENIASGRWNAALKQKIRNSRTEGTRNLVQSIAAIEDRPSTLICASAIGLYGDQQDKVLTEDSPAGDGFLADVCREWEQEANKATELGLRVVNVRIGVVLSPKGGALAKMLLPFKLGAGGIVGSGKQYWSWVGLNDLTRIITHCIEDADISGPVNAVSPNAMTNYDFTKAVGRVLKRPTIFPLPAFMAKLVLGEMAEALLLASTRVSPEKLQQSGFKFNHAELEDCLRHELNLS